MTEGSGRRGPASGLMDRRSERDALDQLIEEVRAGQSRALLVRGDPGVGKTTPRAGYTKSRSACQGRVLDLRQDLRRTLESYGPAPD